MLQQPQEINTCEKAQDCHSLFYTCSGLAWLSQRQSGNGGPTRLSASRLRLNPRCPCVVMGDAAWRESSPQMGLERMRWAIHGPVPGCAVRLRLNRPGLSVVADSSGPTDQRKTWGESTEGAAGPSGSFSGITEFFSSWVLHSGEALPPLLLGGEFTAAKGGSFCGEHLRN